MSTTGLQTHLVDVISALRVSTKNIATIGAVEFPDSCRIRVAVVFNDRHYIVSIGPFTKQGFCTISVWYGLPPDTIGPYTENIHQTLDLLNRRYGHIGELKAEFGHIECIRTVCNSVFQYYAPAVARYIREMLNYLNVLVPMLQSAGAKHQEIDDQLQQNIAAKFLK